MQPSDCPLSIDQNQVSVLGLFVTVAVASLLPESARGRLHASMDAHARLLNAAFMGFVIAFAGFGLLRAVLQLARVCQFDL